MAKADTHALERTNPKGQPFIGVCVKCGIQGLSMADANKPCVNPAGLSASETFSLIIGGPDHAHP